MSCSSRILNSLDELALGEPPNEMSFCLTSSWLNTQRISLFSFSSTSGDVLAGAAMPNHSHNGTELTLVLKGAFQDADGYFARGDIEIADSDVQHIPVADIHEDCICLAVTDAPLRFEGLLPRILQKFVRI